MLSPQPLHRPKILHYPSMMAEVENRHSGGVCYLTKPGPGFHGAGTGAGEELVALWETTVMWKDMRSWHFGKRVVSSSAIGTFEMWKASGQAARIDAMVTAGNVGILRFICGFIGCECYA
jgi:hypothetical protein